MSLNHFIRLNDKKELRGILLLYYLVVLLMYYHYHYSAAISFFDVS